MKVIYEYKVESRQLRVLKRVHEAPGYVGHAEAEGNCVSSVLPSVPPSARIHVSIHRVPIRLQLKDAAGNLASPL